MIYLLIVITILIVIINKFIFKRYATAYSVIMIPYAVIAIFNNFYVTRYGFYAITEKTLFMIIVGSISFFMGSIILHSLYGKIHTGRISKGEINTINIRKAANYVSAILLIRIINLLYIFGTHSLNAIIANDFSLLIARGLMGHLMISAFPFVPLIFYNWLQDKSEKKYLIITITFFILAFIETEKAQVLTITIAVFLYCILRNEKYLAIGTVLLVVLVTVFFISNYAIKFVLQGFFDRVDTTYYWYRFWNYIAGGVINSRIVTDIAMDIPINAFHYVLDVLLSIPNLFLLGLANITIGPDVRLAIPYIKDFVSVTNYTTGAAAQRGNVISTMAFIYGNGNLFAFIPVMMLWGMISEYFFGKMLRSKKDANILLCCCYMSFSFISFFGSYYTAASFTERLIYCSVLSFIFSKKVRFVIRR